MIRIRRVVAAGAAIAFVLAGLNGLSSRLWAAGGAGSSPRPLPRTAIVFTGQFDRIRLGLRLLEDRAIDRLFISGVNRGAGLDPDRFKAQFGLSPQLIEDMKSGHLVLATGANTTWENAAEAACWLARHPDIREVVLVTSRRHMARASLALEAALPGGITVTGLASDPDAAEEPQAASLVEHAKLIATWIGARLPWAAWSAAPCLPSR